MQIWKFESAKTELRFGNYVPPKLLTREKENLRERKKKQHGLLLSRGGPSLGRLHASVLLRLDGRWQAAAGPWAAAAGWAGP